MNFSICAGLEISWHYLLTTLLNMTLLQDSRVPEIAKFRAVVFFLAMGEGGVINDEITVSIITRVVAFMKCEKNKFRDRYYKLRNHRSLQQQWEEK